MGEGTIFHFTIEVEMAPVIKPRQHLIQERDELKGKRLLIVDDHATNRRILQLHAKMWGMHARETADPEEALGWIREGDPFDLAILDIHMPKMDGVELAQRIQKKRDASALPPVLFSSLGPQETWAEDSGVAFAGHLVKPLKPSALFDLMMNIIAQRTSITAKLAREPKAHLDAEMALRHPLRIPLAEDNVVNQKLAIRLLAQMGYRVDVAANGQEAIEALERQPYDVILMDVPMPEMDGIQATREIHARWDQANSPRIIARTANAMQGDRERFLNAGMDDYASKPVRVDELVRALRESAPLRN